MKPSILFTILTRDIRPLTHRSAIPLAIQKTYVNEQD